MTTIPLRDWEVDYVGVPVALLPCGHATHLPVHTVGRNGAVSPAPECPVCHAVEPVVLEGWLSPAKGS